MRQQDFDHAFCRHLAIEGLIEGNSTAIVGVPVAVVVVEQPEESFCDALLSERPIRT